MQESFPPLSEVPEFFVPALHQWGIELNSGQLAMFLEFQKLLVEWNKKFNLTAITDPVEVFRKHFLDSLSLLQVYHKANSSLLDIGTGAGFPGIPLKIISPDWSCTLLEATHKKVRFVETVIQSLALSRIQVLHGRAEEWESKSVSRPSFHIITGRAVTQTGKFLAYAARFLKPDGKVILYKKGDIHDELEHAIRIASTYNLELEQVYSFSEEGLGERLLIIWQRADRSER